MSNWQVLALRWGGLLLAVIFAATLVFVYFVVDRPEGETPTNAQQIIYWVLLAVGVVAAVVGFLKKNDSVVE